MATERQPVGMSHVTVIPENFESTEEPSPEDATVPARDGRGEGPGEGSTPTE